MESKYKERAEKLYSEFVSHRNDKDTVIELMCQLAEEVEKVYKDPLVFGETGSIQKVYSKAYVEELLQKQRELCSKMSRIEDINGKRKQHFTTEDMQHFIIVKESILNAKLKIDCYGKSTKKD